MPRSQLNDISKTIMEIYRTSPDAKIKVRGSDGSYIEIDNRELRDVIRGRENSIPKIDKNVFQESFDYLNNAKSRFNTKTPEGYSDCKTNCRCALVSALKALTGKEKVDEAVTELHKQKIIGEREGEFIKSFDNLLGILHGIDSKKGPHPPMTRTEYDAEFALNITTSTINYIVNQSTQPRII